MYSLDFLENHETSYSRFKDRWDLPASINLNTFEIPFTVFEFEYKVWTNRSLAKQSWSKMISDIISFSLNTENIRRTEVHLYINIFKTNQSMNWEHYRLQVDHGG